MHDPWRHHSGELTREHVIRADRLLARAIRIEQGAIAAPIDQAPSDAPVSVGFVPLA